MTPTKPGFYWFRHYKETSLGEEVEQCRWAVVEVKHFDNMNRPGLYCSQSMAEGWCEVQDFESDSGDWHGEAYPPVDAPESKFVNDWAKGTVPV